jgi:hypothetical protein
MTFRAGLQPSGTRVKNPCRKLLGAMSFAGAATLVDVYSKASNSKVNKGARSVPRSRKVVINVGR